MIKTERFRWKKELEKLKKNVDSSSWRLIPGKLNSADIATSECRPKVLPH